MGRRERRSGDKSHRLVVLGRSRRSGSTLERCARERESPDGWQHIERRAQATPLDHASRADCGGPFAGHGQPCRGRGSSVTDRRNCLDAASVLIQGPQLSVTRVRLPSIILLTVKGAVPVAIRIPFSVTRRIGTIAMMIAWDSASYAAHGGSAEAPHVSATEATNGAR
jgi:hypothetical protein